MLVLKHLIVAKYQDIKHKNRYFELFAHLICVNIAIHSYYLLVKGNLILGKVLEVFSLKIAMYKHFHLKVIT